MFLVNYLPEFLYQPLKLSNVRPTDFANSKHAPLRNSIVYTPLPLHFSNQLSPSHLRPLRNGITFPIYYPNQMNIIVYIEMNYTINYIQLDNL